MKRECGILLHITSLPSDEGIGSLDGAARFLDYLESAGVKCWQVLPLNIPDRANSPYSSVSAFAQNPYLIGVKGLVSDGLVSANEVPNIKAKTGFDPLRAKEYKDPVLKLAHERFTADAEYSDFVKRNGYWLHDYALYSALIDKYGNDRNKWDSKFRLRDKNALKDFTEKNAVNINYSIFLQYMFFRQWSKLKKEANSRGIRLMGDIPFYVSCDSVDVWANPKDFKLNEDLLPDKVAGVPPDYFSADGQLWGNPVYDLVNMRLSGYKWWLNRIKQAKTLFDCVRIDHFRAFDAFYQINADAKNARKGKWIKGDDELVGELIRAAGNMEIIAEDLGVQSRGLDKIMKTYSLKGMRVLHFAFDGGCNNPFLPHNYTENCVAYLGTHDNDTTLNWWNGLSSEIKERVFSYVGFESDKEINRKLMKIMCRSKADFVIFTMQDIINSPKRMNTPGTTQGNWEFMIENDDLKDSDAKYLKDINTMFGRT